MRGTKGFVRPLKPAVKVRGKFCDPSRHLGVTRLSLPSSIRSFLVQRRAGLSAGNIVSDGIELWLWVLLFVPFRSQDCGG